MTRLVGPVLGPVLGAVVALPKVLAQLGRAGLGSLYRAIYSWYLARQAVQEAPKSMWLMLAVALLFCAGLSQMRGRTQAVIDALGMPPKKDIAALMSLGEPVGLAKFLNLKVQAHDVQPGVSLHYGQLNYRQLIAWLELCLELDPQGAYPLLAASRLYTQGIQADGRKQMITDWVALQFPKDPVRRWPWMAHVAYVAKLEFQEEARAYRYARILREQTANLPQVPSWAKQLEIFFRIGQDDLETARIMLGALMESGQVKDPNEERFLLKTLKDLETGKIEYGAGIQRRVMK